MSDNPQFPYGAVYFRKSNPPREDWERDYATAAGDGMNCFRHWFMWGAIETAPGVYNWSDYDRQLDLAAESGITTIIAEMTAFSPLWLATRYPDAVLTNTRGERLQSDMHASAVIGSANLSLNCPDVKQLAAQFLSELASRYKDHEAVLGYNINNECHYNHEYFYDRYSVEQFKGWLKDKYGSLQQLGEAWQTYSLLDWDDVHPPYRMGPYTHCLDWLKFKKDNFYELMQWRIDTIRAKDPNHLIMAHGEAAALNNFRLGGSDEWRAAAKVQVYGYTFAHERHGTQLWKQMHAADLVRAGSEGKPYWHNEIQGGPVWFNPFSHTVFKGSSKENGRFPTDEDVRFWSLASIAGGAKGLLNPRWRPLLDGPLFGAYGYYNMDGSGNARSRMASLLAKWSNHPDQHEYCQSVSSQGQIGLLVTQEALAFKYLLGLGLDSDVYDEAISGAYQGFFDNNIQADFVSIKQIDRYDLLFYPFPILMEREDVRRLTEWVERGGKLICQGCPAYFGDTGRVGTAQPSFGLDRLFGVKQHEAEFVADLDYVRFQYAGKEVRGGLFMQSYIPAGAEVRGTYPDGKVAAAEHVYGQGKTLLIGTFPSAGYFHQTDENTKSFFTDMLAWGGKKSEVAVSSSGIHARLSDKPDGGKYIWVLNPGVNEIEAQVSLSQTLGSLRLSRVLWGQCRNEMIRNSIRIKVPSKDGILLETKPMDGE